VRPPRGAESKAWQNECVFQMKKIDFMHSTDSKILREIKGNSINSFGFFKVHNFCQEAAIVITRPGRPKNPYLRVPTLSCRLRAGGYKNYK
jgi:hypothetical protein